MSHADELLGLALAASRMAEGGALPPPTIPAVVSLFTATAPGLVPASGGGTTLLLRSDGTWANSLTGGLTISGGNFVSRGINDSGTALALVISATGNVTVAAPSNSQVSFQATGNSTNNLAIQALENAGVHAIYIRPNTGGVNLISSNWLSGGAYKPLSLSGREVAADFTLGIGGGASIGAPTAGQTLTVAPSPAAGELIATSSALTNGAGVAAGTLTTAPTAGNPTKWIKVNDNGTVRSIPAW